MKLKTFRQGLLHDHSPESIQKRIGATKYDSLIRDVIYGGSDGIVTTFAIVAGVSGADLSEITILILGLSNVLADGFSMAAGNYLGTKTEVDQKNLILEFEKKEIANNPDGEIEEVRQIFRNKGFEGEILEQIVRGIIEDRQLWIKTMLTEEYGLPDKSRKPLKAASSTFFAFFIFGMIPLLPYLMKMKDTFLWSIVMTGSAFITLGSFQSIWSVEPAWKTALKTLLIGGAAAALAYITGVYLKGMW